LVVDAGDLLAPGTTVGEYVIEGVLGQGGMGTVYAAHHPVIGKKAAVKVIRAALSANRRAVERFVLEARAVNQIGDPNIVDVFAFGSLADGRSYLIMERLIGENLAQRTRRDRVSRGEAIDIIDDIARTLTATHEAGIIHRDLKPDNVFLCDARRGRPTVKLLDFGLAKLARQDDHGGGGLEPTRTGIVIGTPLYLSPEQASGAPVDARTDVYSLGVIAYELLLERPLFTAETAVELMGMHIGAPPDPPRSVWLHIPPDLDALLLGMLDKDPARRPTLDQIRRVMARMREAEAPTSQPWPSPQALAPVNPAMIPPPAVAGPPSRSRARTWIFAFLAIVLLAAGVTGAVLALRGR
jgi:serine/threonine-protein kinase